MTLTIEILKDRRGKYLLARDNRYSMHLRLYLQDVGFWLEHPTQQHWGSFSYSNSIRIEDVKTIRKYIMDKKFFMPVGKLKRMNYVDARLVGYPLSMLLKYIKRTKIKSICGDKLLSIVNSK